MRDRMMGFYGDQILINGQANFKLDVASRAYRFRVLNGSTARIYKLAWDDNTPLTVIGTDGGLLETPVNKPYLMLAPAERLDLWVDFSGRKVGSQLVLRSRSFSGALPAMAGRMMGGHHGGGLVMGSDYPLLSVKVTREISDSPKLPSSLSKISRYQLGGTANPKQPVPIAISEGPMRMVLNGKPYAYNDPLPSDRIPVNTVQLLEIFHEQSGHGMGNGNDDEHGVGHGMGGGMGMGRGMGRGMGGGMGMGGGGMGMNMSMAHPIHLHGQYFLILSRNQTASSEAYGTVKDGFVDNGWKDTVLVMPGETIKIIKPFEDFKGLFMYHCHNLEHEDMGMMREFLVQ